MIVLWAFILSVAIVYVYDYVAFPRNFLARIYSVIFNKEVTLDRIKLPKLLECSLCATTWTTLILYIIFCPSLAPLALVHGWSTKHILYMINIIDSIFENTLSYIYDRVNKR